MGDGSRKSTGKVLYEVDGDCHVGAVSTGSLGEWAAESRQVPSSSAHPGGIGPRRGGSPRGWGRPERLRGECPGWLGRDPGVQARSPGPDGGHRPARRGGSASLGPRPSLLPSLTRGPRATTPRDSPLAGYLSPGHPATWPLHFRDTTLCAELRGGTEGSMEAGGGGRTSGLPCYSLSRGGARSFVRPRPLVPAHSPEPRLLRDVDQGQAC